jgi:hypothetical protein
LPLSRFEPRTLAGSLSKIIFIIKQDNYNLFRIFINDRAQIRLNLFYGRKIGHSWIFTNEAVKFVSLCSFLLHIFPKLQNRFYGTIHQNFELPKYVLHLFLIPNIPITKLNIKKNIIDNGLCGI